MLETIDLEVSLTKEEFRERLLPLQLRLRALARHLYTRQQSVVVVYEGWDAAGKGGNIRRVTEKLDPRGYHVYSIAAPSGEDKTHHYLWRFWRRLKPADEKQLVVFDRSWYGRALVERVEGFATESDWRRAYREINEFERQLADAGFLIAKFWLHLSQEEQLQRFESREVLAHKRWKLTDEDWRNRERWQDYEAAVAQMLVKTSTVTAPWTIVEGNCKYWARIKVLDHLVGLIEARVDPSGQTNGKPCRRGGRDSDFNNDVKKRKKKKRKGKRREEGSRTNRKK